MLTFRCLSSPWNGHLKLSCLISIGAKIIFDLVGGDILYPDPCSGLKDFFFKFWECCSLIDLCWEWSSAKESCLDKISDAPSQGQLISTSSSRKSKGLTCSPHWGWFLRAILALEFPWFQLRPWLRMYCNPASSFSSPPSVNI